MHIFFSLSAVILGIASAQTYPECTMEAARSDDCAAVINANACYNKFKWNSQTLTCIDGTDNAVKAKKVCKCCTCVGKVMCDWATKQKMC
ncbi:hypothetical protein HBH98_145220 [Parastagonospora nodorum]|nr:hypothetical protein HBH53_153440 [Parastagonospora nodorum]KAH3960604.1 hypothetical protein HBH52_236570 [Parastagonospora nodorum]KAH3964904.1 hypothetical protein HBH51_153980 [Parastagonospora nodorum]KAH4014493.1 hypothetical protein HBI09_211270 [Parastagonospora nodorum]KAH4046980.1 hypothetical protein HBH49_175750 [Parastagonospora nodorum]